MTDLSAKQKLSNFVFRHKPLRMAKAYFESAPALAGAETCSTKEWSQHGEDPVLCDLLKDHLKDGYYVDVGANHPLRRSNTYRLYCQGMRGITVEPNLELHMLQRQIRPDDTHLGAGVAAEAGLLVFYEFNYHVFSTYSREDCDNILADESNIGAELLATNPMPVFPLSQILDDCRPADRETFALLSVDTEGLDLQVLESNDWKKYPPLYVIAEANDAESGEEITAYLETKGYKPINTFEVNTLYTKA